MLNGKSFEVGNLEEPLKFSALTIQSHGRRYFPRVQSNIRGIKLSFRLFQQSLEQGI